MKARRTSNDNRVSFYDNAEDAALKTASADGQRWTGTEAGTIEVVLIVYVSSYDEKIKTA